MRSVVLAAVWCLATADASAQQPAATFDALAGRIPIGEQIWVTDSAGRESHGRLDRLSNDELVVQARRLETFRKADVRRVRVRTRDPLKNGTLLGLGIGGGLATAWCVAAVADDSPRVNGGVECAEGYIVYPALGALIGLAVDAVIPGRMRVVYQAAPREEPSRASLNLAPLLSARTKRLAVSFAF